MKLSNACNDFILHCKHARNLSPHSIRAYQSDLAEFSAYLKDDLDTDTIDRDALRGYLHHLFEVRGLKETSVKRRLACLKSMYSWLFEEEQIDDNPFHRFKPRIKQPKRLPRTLSKQEIRLMLTTPAQALGINERKNYHKLLTRKPMNSGDYRQLLTLLSVELLFATGMRVGELVSIQLENLNLAEQTIKITGKGDRQRHVFIPDQELETLIHAYLKQRTTQDIPQPSLLLSHRAGPIDTQQIRRLIANTAKKANLSRRITPHMFRHSTATYLLEAGLDIRYVQTLLGHQSITTTQIYTSVNDGKLKAMIQKAGLSQEGVLCE